MKCKDCSDEYIEYKSSVNDGLYVELFAVKNGQRYNYKIMNLRDVTKILTNSLCDGIEKMYK